MAQSELRGGPVRFCNRAFFLPQILVLKHMLDIAILIFEALEWRRLSALCDEILALENLEFSSAPPFVPKKGQ